MPVNHVATSMGRRRTVAGGLTDRDNPAASPDSARRESTAASQASKPARDARHGV